MNCSPYRSQQGATLIVGLIMLVMTTLMVITAQNMSTNNLKAVGNMQFRDEAIACANKAIRQVLSSSFTAAPAVDVINCDIDNNNTTDYVVNIARPECIRAWQAGSQAASSLSLPTTMSTGATWHTIWDIDATVIESENAGGAVIHVRSGVRVLLTQTQKNAVCS